MRLSLAFAALAGALPAFADAIPPRVGAVIPLTKRATEVMDDRGVANSEVLKSLGAETSRKFNNGFLAYEKNTGRAHPFAMRVSGTIRGRDAGSGANPLTSHDNTLWSGPISVGTPPAIFTVDFDTGSSDLFLPGTNCSTSCDGHKTYDTSTSSTAKNLDQPFALKFGDNSTVEGNVFTDTVTVAGLTATNQSVGAASQYSSSLSVDQFPSDGLMGMAFPQISVFGTNPFFWNLVAQDGAAVPQFSFKLAASGSELFLGGVNTDLFVGDFTTVDVTHEGFWQVSLDRVNAGDKTPISEVQAIIDTGTTLIAAPEQDVAQFYKDIPGSQNASSTIGPGFYTFPCDSNPEVSLTFGGKQFAITGFNVGKTEEGSSECVGGIMALSDVEFWVVGDIFLSGYYTRFDTGAKQVGFASLAKT